VLDGQGDRLHRLETSKSMTRVMILFATILATASATRAAQPPAVPADGQPFSGKRSDYRGYQRYDFVVDGCPATVVVPRQAAAGKPWIWRAEFFFLLCGDADDIVPCPENGALVKQRYEKLGGPLTLLIKQGLGHHPHGLADPTPLVEFILKYTLPAGTPVVATLCRNRSRHGT